LPFLVRGGTLDKPQLRRAPPSLPNLEIRMVPPRSLKAERMPGRFPIAPAEDDSHRAALGCLSVLKLASRKPRFSTRFMGTR
jgi:hypothetical protein